MADALHYGHIAYGHDSCENAVLWRGHFISNGNEKSVNLSINGGEGEHG